MAKRGGGSGRKYVRDSIGRFASKGFSGQSSGRGARLKAKGKKRDGGGAIVKPKRIGEMKNTISKSSSKRKVNASSRATDRQIARDIAARSKPAAAKPAAANKISRSPRQLNKDEKIARDVMTDKRFKSDRQRVTEMQRRGVKPGTDVVGLVAKARSKQGGGTTGRIKPAAAKRSGAVGKISEAKAGRIVARMDAQRGRKALPGRRNANFVRTYERSRQFILKPSTAALKKGKPISVNESVQKAVANAAKRRKAKPAAAKPAAAKTKLKRSGKKIGVGRLTTNEEQGRKGIVSMSSQAKAARKGAVAERKSAKMSRIAERQSEIVARRQGRRASNYNPDGTFNQSTFNANQRRLGRSKQLQEKLRYAGGGKNIASKALSKRRKPK
jgi:hypothetical protein